MADMLRLVAPAWKVCRHFCVSAIHSSCSTLQTEDGGSFFFFWYLRMGAGSRSREVQDASSHLFALNRGYVKVGSRLSLFALARACFGAEPSIF